jgi:hypothetical protein
VQTHLRHGPLALRLVVRLRTDLNPNSAGGVCIERRDPCRDGSDMGRCDSVGATSTGVPPYEKKLRSVCGAGEEGRRSIRTLGLDSVSSSDAQRAADADSALVVACEEEAQ